MQLTIFEAIYVFQVHNESCQDFKYDKMINELRNTTWPEEGGVGGEFKMQCMYNV